MTPREWILKCYATEAAASQRREDKRQENIRRSPKRMIKKRNGQIVERPWPEPKPIGCGPKKIFGPAKQRPQGYDLGRLEGELTAMRKDGTLAFASGVWWKR